MLFLIYLSISALLMFITFNIHPFFGSLVTIALLVLFIFLYFIFKDDEENDTSDKSGENQIIGIGWLFFFGVIITYFASKYDTLLGIFSFAVFTIIHIIVIITIVFNNVEKKIVGAVKTINKNNREAKIEEFKIQKKNEKIKKMEKSTYDTHNKVAENIVYDAGYYNKKGFESLEKGSPDKAADYFKLGLDTFKLSFVSNTMYFECCNHCGRHDEAKKIISSLSFYKSCLNEISLSKSPQSYYYAGLHCFMVNNDNDAIKHLLESINRDDNNYDCYFLIGISYLRIGDIVNASKQLRYLENVNDKLYNDLLSAINDANNSKINDTDCNLEHFRMLEVDANASLSEIKKAYRDMVKIWHPDRYEHDQDLRKKAEEKIKKINAAYAALSAN